MKAGIVRKASTIGISARSGVALAASWSDAFFVSAQLPAIDQANARKWRLWL
jgi:hypothetical protein